MLGRIAGFTSVAVLLLLVACQDYGGVALTPSRQFMAGRDIPPRDVAAYGVVALTAKPTPASQARLLRLCQAYLASLPPRESLRNVPPSRQMVTIWPVENPRAILSGHERCDQMLGEYDLYAGQSAIADAFAQGRAMSGRGPFLIGWSPSSSRGVPDAVVLVIDMSLFESQASFDDAFRFWQRRIVEDPELWRSGFVVWRIRNAVRDFADEYGDAILKALSFKGSKE
jgi:hypothetical protein